MVQGDNINFLMFNILKTNVRHRRDWASNMCSVFQLLLLLNFGVGGVVLDTQQKLTQIVM